VTGLPISLGSVDYYQVYFSVLAALGPRDPTYCPRAMQIVQQVRASGYEAQRPDITSNITAAQLQCSDTGSAIFLPTTTPPAGTPVPVFTSTAFPTETLVPISAP
jgi:hypothetical protein